MANKLMKSGETEKAIKILEELAAARDTDAAEKLTLYYRKTGNTEKFESYRALAIELIQSDETLGKWSKSDKIAKLGK